MKIAFEKYRTLIVLLFFFAVWFQRHNIRDFFEGVFEGYGQNQIEHSISTR